MKLYRRMLNRGTAALSQLPPNYVLWQTLNNPNTYASSLGDKFGTVVATSDNYMVVGVPNELDRTSQFDAGKVYIFDIITGAKLRVLDNPGAAASGNTTDDQFGCSVAVSGNYVIVGAINTNSSYVSNSGKAYVFNVTTGALIYTFENPNVWTPGENDQFGNSVAISGDYAIVGASNTDTPYEDPELFANTGRAYIFNLIYGTLAYTLNNPNTNNNGMDDGFGNSVAISGNYAIVGASLTDGPPTDIGRAYIFDVTTGALIQTLDSPNGIVGAYDNFGGSVAISGNYAVVGATAPSAAYVFDVTTGALVRTINNPNAYGTNSYDQFGNSVAISGDYAIIGAIGEDDAGGIESGKAYVFDVTTGALIQTLNNPNAYGTSAFDQFGTGVAISGNYAIVGAYTEDASTGNNSGAVYAFNRTSGALIYTVVDPNVYGSTANDQFGITLDISGNYAIVGAYGEDAATGMSSGNAYIFDVTTGALIHTLNNPNAYGVSQSDEFGRDVAISGNYAIVGATGESTAAGASSGNAYIFDVTTGALVRTINNPNVYGTTSYDYFGTSIDMSGNYAIVGAIGEADVGGGASGKVYVFNVTTGALIQTLNNPNAYGTSAGDQFGASVAISGNYAIVGTFGESDAGGNYSGKAYVFDVTTGALIKTLNNPNAYGTSTFDKFATTVAISGNYAIVGAPGEDAPSAGDSGKAYVFDVTTGALIKTLNNPNAYGTSAYDQFGTGVAISGNYAIVGATGEDETARQASGKAYVFNVTTGALIQTLNNPNAYGTSAGDQFASKMVISGDYAIIASPGEGDINGINSAKAYIFKNLT